MNLIALLGLTLALLVGGNGAQRPEPRSPSPEERARLEHLREEFEHLSPSAKRKLLERAHALREREKMLELEVTPELREELEQGDPDECRQMWRRHLRERIRASGKELYEKLPGHLKRRLELAEPAERRALLERLLSDPEGVGARVARRLCERLGLPPGERRRFEEMAPLERLRRLHELDKQERHTRRNERRERLERP